MVAYKAHANDPRIAGVIKDMDEELGSGNTYPDLLERMAQYELTLLDWAEANLGQANTSYLQTNAGLHSLNNLFEPCYVNSRLASREVFQ